MLLVTGGLGFIGSHLAREFLAAGEPVVVTRHPSDTVADFLAPYSQKTLFIEPVDVTSPHALTDLCLRHHVTSIIHLAGPGIGLLSPGEEYRQNTSGLINVLEAGRMAGVRRVSIASSIGVYMGAPSGPFKETMSVRVDAKHPIEAYKKAEEIMGLYYAGAVGMDLISLRLASIYGPLYRSLRHLPAQLVHAAVACKPGPAMRVGVPTYHADDHATDLCYVSDCVRGIRLVHSSTTLHHRIYNIGGGADASNARYLDAARAAFPESTFDLPAGTSPSNWPHAILDCSRALHDVGYEPQFTIVDAMKDYARWLQTGHPF